MSIAKPSPQQDPGADHRGEELGEVFIARQPIFDRERKLQGYELLFRSGEQNAFGGGVDGSAATAQVIQNCLVIFGFKALTGGKPAFINLTADLLEGGLVELFSPEQLVVEILEDVEGTEAVIEACRGLKAAGYRLALDDVIYADRFGELEGLADIVKVDFMGTDEGERARIAEALVPKGVTLLAEKVETYEEFERALAQGYSLFQGYFFAKPEVLRKATVAPAKLQILRMLNELHRAELDVARLEEVLKGDVALSYRLLRFINSAQFALRVKVNSLNHALRLLGPVKVRRWATLLSLATLGDDKPAELTLVGLGRAKLCETLGALTEMSEHDDDLFLMGMFSILDALIDQPLEQALNELSLSDTITDALLDRGGPLQPVLRLVLTYERGCWDEVDRGLEPLGLDRWALTRAYLESMAWAREGLTG